MEWAADVVSWAGADATNESEEDQEATLALDWETNWRADILISSRIETIHTEDRYVDDDKKAAGLSLPSATRESAKREEDSKNPGRERNCLRIR